jgi:phospholipid/cholesterol/gamma-HCH transport system substrate-binding protein
MKLNLSREVKIGIFFLIILIATFSLLNFLKGRDLFKNTNHYYAVYENVEGLSPSSHVFLKGLKIGSIEKIIFDPNNQEFIVRMTINHQYHIPENSVAQIFSTDIMGNKAVRIVFSNNDNFINNGDTLKANSVPELTTVLVDELIPLKQKVDTLIERLNIAATAINMILNQETQKNLVESISYLRNTMYTIQQFSSALEKEKGNIRNITANINDFTTELQKSSTDITRTIHNIAQFTDSLQTANIGATIESLNALLQQANNPEGSIGQLLHNDDLYKNVSRTIDHLDSLIVAIKANPKKFVKISLF